MPRLRWSAMASIVVMLVIICALLVSFLPYFVEEAWAPLWDPEWQPAGSPARSFSRVGPWCGVVPWPLLLAVPISSLMVLAWFMLVARIFLLRKR
jgi:hypothetical protein